MELSSSNPMECSTCGCNCSLITSSLNTTWPRTFKRKFEQVEKQDGSSGSENTVARVEVENECVALRETLSIQQETLQELYTELEEERNASESAANEAMSMILRLQREKAEIQMEARQFRRYAEEKMAHDQEELLALEDMLVRGEEIVESLSSEVEMYKHRMLSYGLTEEEVEGNRSAYRRTTSMPENNDAHFGFPPLDYPPLRCNINETHDPIDLEDIADSEKYDSVEIAHSGATPRSGSGEIPQATFGETPKSSPKVVLEQGVTEQSPRRPKLGRRLSGDSSSSLSGFVKEIGQDYYQKGSPMASSSFKKVDDASQTEDNTDLKKVENASDLGDDMSDRVYTVDSIYHEAHNNNSSRPRTSSGVCEDHVTTPRGSLNQSDVGDIDIKRLYMRLQLLEADRESMKEAIISMRTEKAQLVLLREIAQHIYKDLAPERRMPVRKTSLSGSFSVISALKWMVSFIFWRSKAQRSKYTFGLSASNAGLLLLLDRGPNMRQWRCLTRAQIKC